MSVLIEKICTPIGGGSSSSYPPPSVANMISRTDNGKIIIRWSEPEHTIVNSEILSTWASTILVKNDNYYPQSPKDGTIILTNTARNAYETTPFEDTDIVSGHTYYYRFFTISTDGVYNTDPEMAFNSITIHAIVDPILANNSWQTISEVSEYLDPSTYWKVGDEINVTTTNTNDPVLTFQIYDFNYYDKSDGSGKASILFGMKYLTKSQYYMDEYNSKYTYNSLWKYCYMRNTNMVNIYNSLQEDLKGHIKQVSIPSSGYGKEDGDFNQKYKHIYTDDKIFLPNTKEIGKANGYWSGADTGDYPDKFSNTFQIYTSYKPEKKKTDNGNGEENYYWLRSGNAGTFYGSLEGLTLSGPTAEVELCLLFCI